jgi:hypothetical protein
VGPALRLSCRSELHVLPRFPVAQTIRSPDHDELRGPHRCLQSGPACYGFVCHPGISPLSRYGIQLALVLPSVLPVMSLQTSCGLHRFEPVAGAVLPPSWAMSLTRQGISLGPYPSCLCRNAFHTWAKQRVPFTLLLHVAMQMGLYLHRRSASSSSAFGV